MTCVKEKRTHGAATRFISAFLVFFFSFGTIIPPYIAEAQVIPMLPIPGSMVVQTPGYIPALIKGITIYPENPLAFDFIIDTGESGIEVESQQFKHESMKLIKYFMASLTVPEEEMWVNLSPYEKDRVIPESFAQTEMGINLLAQDYILKQLTASLMYPEDELGKKFWNRVYERAQKEFGTTDIPMDSFHKVWIVPKDALVYQTGNQAFVIRNKLKVMLEQDYFAMRSNQLRVTGNELREGESTSLVTRDSSLSKLQTQIMREVVIPEIEKEVNEGKNFAQLRQIFQSSVLAAWFKQNLKESLVGQVYVDQKKMKGIDIDGKSTKEEIYQQYVKAFEKGVYNYIKEDYDPVTQEVIPRQYFSGGVRPSTSGEDGIPGTPDDTLSIVVQGKDKIPSDVKEEASKALEKSNAKVGVNFAESEKEAAVKKAEQAEATEKSGDEGDNAMLVQAENFILEINNIDIQPAMSGTYLVGYIAAESGRRIEKALRDIVNVIESGNEEKINILKKQLEAGNYRRGSLNFKEVLEMLKEHNQVAHGRGRLYFSRSKIGSLAERLLESFYGVPAKSSSLKRDSRGWKKAAFLLTGLALTAGFLIGYKHDKEYRFIDQETVSAINNVHESRHPEFGKPLPVLIVHRALMGYPDYNPNKQGLLRNVVSLDMSDVSAGDVLTIQVFKTTGSLGTAQFHWGDQDIDVAFDDHGIGQVTIPDGKDLTRPSYAAIIFPEGQNVVFQSGARPGRNGQQAVYHESIVVYSKNADNAMLAETKISPTNPTEGFKKFFERLKEEKETSQLLDHIKNNSPERKNVKQTIEIEATESSFTLSKFLSTSLYVDKATVASYFDKETSTLKVEYVHTWAAAGGKGSDTESIRFSPTKIQIIKKGDGQEQVSIPVTDSLTSYPVALAGLDGKGKPKYLLTREAFDVLAAALNYSRSRIVAEATFGVLSRMLSFEVEDLAAKVNAFKIVPGVFGGHVFEGGDIVAFRARNALEELIATFKRNDIDAEQLVKALSPLSFSAHLWIHMIENFEETMISSSYPELKLLALEMLIIINTKQPISVTEAAMPWTDLSKLKLLKSQYITSLENQKKTDNAMLTGDEYKRLSGIEGLDSDDTAKVLSAIQEISEKRKKMSIRQADGFLTLLHGDWGMTHTSVAVRVAAAITLSQEPFVGRLHFTATEDAKRIIRSSLSTKDEEKLGVRREALERFRKAENDNAMLTEATNLIEAINKLVPKPTMRGVFIEADSGRRIENALRNAVKIIKSGNEEKINMLKKQLEDGEYMRAGPSFTTFKKTLEILKEHSLVAHETGGAYEYFSRTKIGSLAERLLESFYGVPAKSSSLKTALKKLLPFMAVMMITGAGGVYAKNLSADQLDVLAASLTNVTEVSSGEQGVEDLEIDSMFGGRDNAMLTEYKGENADAIDVFKAIKVLEGRDQQFLHQIIKGELTEKEIAGRISEYGFHTSGVKSLSKATIVDGLKELVSAEVLKVKAEDSSMTDVGGIDLNPEFLDLKIKRDGAGIPLPMIQQSIEEMMLIEGFLPVIINVTPIQNLPMLLGLDVEPDNRRDEAVPRPYMDKIDKVAKLN